MRIVIASSALALSLPRRLITTAIAGLSLLAVGCRQPQPGSGRPSVVAADGALCDLTRRLAGSSLPVTCLLRPGDDPHQLQLSPQQGRTLQQASRILVNGYGLTPALERLPEAIKVAERAAPNSPRLDSPDGGGRDPHVWHDPRQAAAMVGVISSILRELSPANGREIQRREQAMVGALLALDRWNREQFDSIPAPPLLATSHRAFASLSRAYGLKERPLVDPHSSSDSVRPQELNEALADLQRDHPARLFSDQQPPTRTMQRISSLSGIPIAAKPLQADAAMHNLMASLSDNTCLISESLQGRCDRRGQRELIRRWESIR